jgi:hypothetical protein
MGMIFTVVAFEGEMPTKEALEHRLKEATGLRVRIEFTGDPEKPESGEWQINFESTTDGFKQHIWCFRNEREIHVQELADVLNRCPHYLMYATEAALISLGGTRPPQPSSNPPRKKIPDYALGTFAQWKKLNRGSRPPWWKISLAWVIGTLYFLLIILAYLLLLPIIVMLGIIIWIKTRIKPA